MRRQTARPTAAQDVGRVIAIEDRGAEGIELNERVAHFRLAGIVAIFACCRPVFTIISGAAAGREPDR